VVKQIEETIMTARDIPETDERAAAENSPAGSRLNLLDLQGVPDSERRATQQSGNLCQADLNFQQLSLVGSIMSFRKDVDQSCQREAHPSQLSEFNTIELTNGNAAQLTDYFRAEDIYEALMADRVVQKALGSVNAKPGNLNQLLHTLSRGGIQYIEEPSDTSKALCFSMNDDLLFHFAFDHLEGDKVAVRIGLPGTGVCRANLTQVGILLPVPAELKEAFKVADKGSGGFLMKDAKTKGAHSSLHRSWLDDLDSIPME
jgi:hypothetical protein